MISLLPITILKERIKVDEGYYIIPEGPGLGVEVDEEKIKDLTLNSTAQGINRFI